MFKRRKENEYMTKECIRLHGTQMTLHASNHRSTQTFTNHQTARHTNSDHHSDRHNCILPAFSSTPARKVKRYRIVDAGICVNAFVKVLKGTEQK